MGEALLRAAPRAAANNSTEAATVCRICHGLRKYTVLNCTGCVSMSDFAAKLGDLTSRAFASCRHLFCGVYAGQVDTVCNHAARGGHLQVLRWARQHECPWGTMTCPYAAQGGHLECAAVGAGTRLSVERLSVEQEKV